MLDEAGWAELNGDKPITILTYYTSPLVTNVLAAMQAMLAQVTRAEKSKKAIVFLAWAPHPMNTAHALTYLSGGDAYFGPDYGGATVWTLARTGWAAKCPNAAKFFQKIKELIEL